MARIMHINIREKRCAMIRGIITTKHIVFHPITLINALGFFGYLRLLVKCFCSKSYCFMDFFLI